ncbi:MAG: hypothetical protein ABW104_14070 [Candidatus Thiodiazotropha sp. 6PLUC2]
MQDAVDYLNEKAQAKIQFNDDEKEFLKELYEAFGWVGLAKGMPEAAALADHYVSSGGEPLEMDSEPYKESVVVNDTMDAMKSHIKDLAENNQIDNVYDFEPYSKGSKISDLFLNESLILKLPDGLSEYMDSGLRIAEPFNYHAKWTEVWRWCLEALFIFFIVNSYHCLY